jgi:transcriptional/translational regulatory protein YebC/TACO1
VAKHNRWSKVKHRKAVVDKRRGKVWTKIIRAIMVAARQAGPDPSSNVGLRFALDEARYANIPRDTVERAIKKGCGDLDTSSFEVMRYEGYAPGGIAVIVDALTDNRARTIADVRLAFGDVDGNVGATGSVAYMFTQKGVIVIQGDHEDKSITEDQLMEAALNAGADDIESPTQAGEDWTVFTDPIAFETAKKALESAGYPIREAQIAMIPSNRIEVRGEHAKAVMELVDTLEELDDIQKVYTNADIPDDELAKLE